MTSKSPDENSTTFEPTTVWRDGTLIPFASATTHVLSHMSARGSQIFDVLLVVGDAESPTALGLREHVTRFVRSAETMGMDELPDISRLERAVARTVMTNLAEATTDVTRTGPLVVKLIASWDAPSHTVVPASRRPTVYITVTPLGSGGEAMEQFTKVPSPIAVKTAAMPKVPASVLPPSMKVAAGYTPGLRHHLMAADEGFDQVVFRTIDGGDLAESVTSSVFTVADGRIAVPPVDTVLDGITRRAVLDVAEHLGVPYTVRAVAWAEVETADELFLSSSIRMVLPVGRLDDRVLDAPGPVTTALAEGMGRMLTGEHPLDRRWMTPLAPLAGD
ncbi:MAG: aminotransferase class IV [Acidimicrobiia bacterium]|nr:aminotransferase class IV [Acidimicrobiia bacterium]